jgi:hypothetical protein
MQPIQSMPNNDMPYQGVTEDGSPHGYDQYSPDEGAPLSRKRTFSMAEGTPIGYSGQFQRDRMQSMGSWSNQGGQSFRTQRASFSGGPDPSSQPNPDEIVPPFWFKGTLDLAALEASEGVQTNPDFKWNDDAIEA